jgi:Tfp pilus assembly protein FimT
MRRRGHALVELVMVIALGAILAGVAAPAVLDMTPARSFAAARRFAADVRFAQRLATTSHTSCGVVVTGATTYTVFKGNSSTPATDPWTQGSMTVDLGTSFPGVSIAPTGGIVTFDTRGRPAAGFTGSFTFGTRAVAITAETGEVQY